MRDGLADRRTDSWRADEVGKRSVLLLVRIWWYRVVSGTAVESIKTDDTSARKKNEAMEAVWW